MSDKTRATNHYAFYPTDEKQIPAYLAYGFRPIFLLLAPYLILSMALWGFIYSGVLHISFMNDILTWHIYEMVFGVLTAGVMAFLTTGLPELFPGMIPFVGKRLLYILALWVAGRISFWTIDITGVFLTAVLNLSMLLWLIWFAKDVVLDPLQRHSSLGYTLLLLFFVECWFFASMYGFGSFGGMEILKFSIGLVVILILLALRRVNMEAINEILEDKGIDDVYVSRPPFTNLAIFCIALFSIVELLSVQSSTIGWVSLACGASIIGITSDYNLKDKFILNQPYVIYIYMIYLMFGAGYIFIGFDMFDDSTYAINHFRHFITSGGIGLSYVIVMIIISYVHTGRKLESNIYTHFMVFLMILATLIRVSVAFFEQYSHELYLYSSMLWILPFLIYIKQFFRFLVNPRADGIKG